jgi:oligopeptide/dipeptide ABC transporter ATP-binding protein
VTVTQPEAQPTAGRTAREPLLQIRNLVKHFPITSGVFFRRQIGAVRAVEGVSFDVYPGETLSLVGESGCGKSTTARTALRLLEPTSGQVFFRDEDVTAASTGRLRELRREMQIVFQDPYASLNPRLTVSDIVTEPFKIHRVREHAPVEDLLERVGLAAEHARRYPHEFSGGQRQRIGIARAIALNPALVFLDEPVSALDVSIQAQVVNLLEDIQDVLKLTYVFIAHDLSVVRHLSDRVAVMYLGHIVEIADRNRLFEQPRHPYTQSIISAVPIPDPRKERERRRIVLRGDVPSPANPPSGCPFHPRCPKHASLTEPEKVICREQMPALLGDPTQHAVACHYAEAQKVI